jgi:hypothetical protein
MTNTHRTTERAGLVVNDLHIGGEGGVQFESRPKHRLSTPRFVLVLLSLCMQIPQQYLDLTTTASFLVLSNSSPIRHPVIRQLRCPDTDSAVKGGTSKRHKGSSVYSR